MLATVFVLSKSLYVKYFLGLFIFVRGALHWYVKTFCLYRGGQGASLFAVFGLREGFVRTANGLAPVWGLFDIF